ncbi:MAG TPA: hypothetical protein VGF65_06040 [Mycobacterium sp.]
MIDFPNAPVDGQVFNAGSGVMYQWLASPGAWVTYSVPGGAGGDFCAVSAATQGIDSVVRVMTPTSVITGNTGGFFNTANGRFTPPAGRYCIYGLGTYLTPAAANTTFYIYLYKNGASIGLANTGYQATASATLSLAVEGTVDANGTDYFELRAAATQGATLSNCIFGAFPTGRSVPALPVAGDFTATGGVYPQSVGADTLVPFGTVITGNSGGWWNTTTNRYTPPAGRYLLSAYVATQAPSASNGTWTMWFRKNGVHLPGGMNGSGAASFAIPISITQEVDANGTDVFDVVANQAIAGMTAQGGNFTAFPIGGAIGPPGPPGVVGTTWRQLQRTVVSSPQASVDIINIPADVNELKVNFALSPASNDANCVLQFYDSSGVLDTTTNHYAHSLSATFGITAIGAASSTSNSNSSGLSTAIGLNYIQASNGVANNATSPGSALQGDMTIPNIRDTARTKMANYRATYVRGANDSMVNIVGGGYRATVGAITGLRLSFTGGNIASGSFEVWGSP